MITWLVTKKKESFEHLRKSFKVIQQIENGKKKDGVRRIFGLINSTIQITVKTEPNLLVHLNATDQK